MVSRMSKKVWLIVAVTIIAVGAIIGIAVSSNPSGQSEVVLPIIAWNETSLSALEGTPVVLNFWSIGCQWCKFQLPFLEDVALQSEGQIEVVAINMVDSAANLQRFFGDYEPAMMIAQDKNGAAFVDYCLTYDNAKGSIPFTLLVDSEGLVQNVRIGAFSSETELWNTLHDVLGITIPSAS
jgi:thiol-disulfide isomerase/thioredoxin